MKNKLILLASFCSMELAEAMSHTSTPLATMDEGLGDDATPVQKLELKNMNLQVVCVRVGGGGGCCTYNKTMVKLVECVLD